MRRSHCARRAGVAALTVLVLAGAAASGPVPASFAYVHSNATPNQVFGFRVGADGALSPLAGSPFDTGNTTSNCGGECESAAYSAARRLLFTTGGQGVSVSRVAADGTLALIGGSPFGAVKLTGIAELEIGTSTFVYASESAANQVRGYAVRDDDTLAEISGSPFAAGMQLDGVAAARTFVFATSDASPAVAAFKAQADGALVAAPGSPFAVATDAGGLQNVFVDPTGKNVYLPDFDASPIRIFGFKVRAKDAKLTKIAGSPYPLTLSSISALAMRGTSSLYAFGPIGHDPADVQFVKRRTSGALAARTAGASGLSFVRSGGVDPSGRVVVLVGDTPSGSEAASFLVGKKGRLTPAGTTPLAGTDARLLNAVVFAAP
jgi:hypothetical protein